MWRWLWFVNMWVVRENGCEGGKERRYWKRRNGRKRRVVGMREVSSRRGVGRPGFRLVYIFCLLQRLRWTGMPNRFLSAMRLLWVHGLALMGGSRWRCPPSRERPELLRTSPALSTKLRHPSVGENGENRGLTRIHACCLLSFVELLDLSVIRLH